MKISNEWLKRCLNFNKTPAEVAETITGLGIEVEGMQTLGVAENPLLVVGEVVEKLPHPDSDHMSVCKVDVGDGTLRQIVCGATNFGVGDRVPVALLGCQLPGDFTIKKAKLRGVESEGMLCAPDEIGLGGAHEGLMILADRPTVGVPLHEVLSNDTIFELKAGPNRPDALSHRGIARDLAAKWNLPMLPVPARDFEFPTSPSQSFKGVKVEDPIACPHYRAYTIRGVKIAPSPAWLQGLLKAVGLRPISNIVDITNFIVLTYGQPLHAFDLTKIEGARLTVRHAKEGETLVTLDDKKRLLDPSMLVIADDKKPLVVAGIMGGVASGVSATTTDIVLEAAQFDATTIRRAGRKLALASDSSTRYEHGIDPLGLQVAAERAVAMILELAGGTLDGAPYVVGAAPHKPVTLEVSQNFLEGRLGFSVGAETIEKALTGFGFTLVRIGEGVWKVTAPSYRLDIERNVDLVEEVLRYIGVDKIPASRLIVSQVPGRDDGIYTAGREMSRHLVALGYNECLHYTLRSKPEVERLVGEGDAKLHGLLNPLSADMAYLRPSLIPGLCDALALNASRGNPEGKFFEVGHTFRVQGGKLFEQWSVAFVRRLTPSPEAWAKRTQADFFSARAVLESLVKSVGLALPAESYERIDASALWQPFHAARLGCIRCGQVMLRAGLVNLDLLKNAGVEGTVLAGEIVASLEAFKGVGATPTTYKPFSIFPSTRRDVALVVDAKLPVGATTAAVQKASEEAAAGKFALESVRLFDRYAGKGVAEGKVSLAYALTFRAMDRTLTDAETNEVFTAILEALKKSGHEIRS